MPIKAKPVDPVRAAFVARGLHTAASRPTCGNDAALSGKHYFYYEAVKCREHAERDDVQSVSSTSSSTSVSRSSSPVRRGSRAGQVLTSEEADRRAAQERTRQLLYPKEEQAQRPSSTPDATGKARLAAYLSAVHCAPLQATTTCPTLTATTIDENDEQHQEATGLATPSPLHHAEVAPEMATSDVEAQAPRHSMTSCAAQSSETPAATPASPSKASWKAAEQDFTRLMDLFARDIAAERVTAASPLPATPPQLTSSISAITDDEAAGSAVRSGTSSCWPSSRTFAQLQQDTLQELYDRWCTTTTNTTTATAATSFVATEHMSEAFSLAAARVQAGSARRTARHVDARERLFSEPDTAPPLTLQDVAVTETWRRNAALRGDTAVTDAAQLAHAAQAQLDRFFAAVRCVERVVRELRFVRSVGQFLYERHKAFLRPISTSTMATDASEQTAVRAYSHEQFAAYVEFSAQVSEVLRRALTAQVPGFDEEEFAAALYATPVTYCEDDAMTWQVTSGAAEQSIGEVASQGPMNVLSFPAWRILLAMSDFAAFCDWVGDYVCEEYNVDTVSTASEGAGHATAATVAGAGARGVRALMRSTYHLRRHMDHAGMDAALDHNAVSTLTSQRAASTSFSDTPPTTSCAVVTSASGAPLPPSMPNTTHETTVTDAARPSDSLRAWMHSMSDAPLAPAPDTTSVPVTPLTHGLTAEQRHSSAPGALSGTFGRGILPISPFPSGATGAASQTLLFARPPHQKRPAARAGRNLPPLTSTSPACASGPARSTMTAASQRVSLCSTEVPSSVTHDSASRKPLSSKPRMTRGMLPKSHCVKNTHTHTE